MVCPRPQSKLWLIGCFHMTSRRPYLCTKQWIGGHICVQNNESAAMFVYKNNPVEIDLFSHVKTFFCSKQFAKLLTTWLKTIYRSQVFGLPLKKSFYSILLELFIQFRTSFGKRKSFVITWRFRRSYHFMRESNCQSVMQVKLCVQRQINANTQEFMFHFIRHHLSSSTH